MDKRRNRLMIVSGILFCVALLWTFANMLSTVQYYQEEGYFPDEFVSSYLRSTILRSCLPLALAAIGVFLARYRWPLYVSLGILSLFSCLNGLELIDILQSYLSLSPDSYHWDAYYYQSQIIYCASDILASIVRIIFLVFCLVLAIIQKRPRKHSFSWIAFFPALWFAVSVLSDVAVRMLGADYNLIYYGSTQHLFGQEVNLFFPFMGYVPQLITVFAYTCLAIGLTYRPFRNQTRLPFQLGLSGAICILSGFLQSSLIAFVSISVYDRVYYFDGFPITAALWLIAYGCMIYGAGTTPFLFFVTRPAKQTGTALTPPAPEPVTVSAAESPANTQRSLADETPNQPS